MLSSRPLEEYCYQIRGILKNRQNTYQQKGTQNVPNFASEAVSPYSYEYESKNVATTDGYDDKIKKNNGNIKHYCKCKTKLSRNAKNPKKAKNNELNKDQSFNEAYNNDVIQANTKKRFNLFSKKRGTYTLNPIKKSLVSLYRKRKNTVETKNIKHTDNSKNRQKKQKNGDNAKLKNKNKENTQQYQISLKDNKTITENFCAEGICRVNAGKGKHHRCMCKNNDIFKYENEKQIGKKSKSVRKNTDKSIFNDYVTYPMTVKRNKLNECMCPENVGPHKNNAFNECLCPKNVGLHNKNVFNECLCPESPGPHKNNALNECLCKDSIKCNKNSLLNECLCKALYKRSNKYNDKIDSLNKNTNSGRLRKEYTNSKKNRFSGRFRKVYADSPEKNDLSDRQRKAYTDTPKNNRFSDHFRKVYADSPTNNELSDRRRKAEVPKNSDKNECLCKLYKDTYKHECLCKEYSRPGRKNSFSDYLRRVYRVTTGKQDCFCKEAQVLTRNNALSKRLRKDYTVATRKNILNDYFSKQYETHPKKDKNDRRRKQYTDDICLCKGDMKIIKLARLGAGDQLLKSECTRKCKYGISGIFKRNKVPTDLIDDRQPKPPLFSIRVDSSNMEVINSDEIKGKVHTFGKVEKNESCICPSRLQNEKYYGIGDTCEAGICESAGKDKYNRFNCKCAKNTIIKCSDTTCDQPIVCAKPNVRQNIPTVKTNKPLFKMVLDSHQMNILNTGEIEDILEKASHTNKCETGICSRLDGNKRTILECKCINKKIRPLPQECDEKTCRPKRSKFYILCSRIFSGSTFTSRSRRAYHPNRRQALVLGASPSPGQRRPVPATGKRIPAPSPGQRRPVGGPYITAKGGPGGGPGPMGKSDIDCMCYCQCKEDMKARKAKGRVKTKGKKKSKTKKVKRSGIFPKKEMAKNLKKTQKEFTKLQKKKAKEERKKERREQKLEEKKRMEIHKQAMKESGEGNFLSNLLNGLMNVTLQSISGIFRALISIIFSPFHSYLYAKNKLKDPIGTAKTFRRWFLKTWKSKESKFSKNITDSDTLNVLADHLEESVIFQTFANKGQTQAERMIYERKSKLRQRRMKKRKNQALYGCRHVLLTTLRKHPCLWVYHVCPGFYPQCLSLMTMCGNFGHILLFLAALLCWTPCILMMELVRGFLCCMLCTQ